MICGQNDVGFKKSEKGQKDPYERLLSGLTMARTDAFTKMCITFYSEVWFLQGQRYGNIIRLSICV